MPRSFHASIYRGAAVLFFMPAISFAQTTASPQAASGTTALHRAVERDDAAEAARLIRAGADVKAVNRYGVASISLACARGNAEIIEQLLQAGADVNTALPEGETCLMSAASAGSLRAVKALLVRGANVNAVEAWKGQTALMWAAAEGHAAVVDALIESGADVNARSKAGFTPLVVRSSSRFCRRSGQPREGEGQRQRHRESRGCLIELHGQTCLGCDVCPRDGRDQRALRRRRSARGKRCRSERA